MIHIVNTRGILTKYVFASLARRRRRQQQLAENRVSLRPSTLHQTHPTGHLYLSSGRPQVLTGFVRMLQWSMLLYWRSWKFTERNSQMWRVCGIKWRILNVSWLNCGCIWLTHIELESGCYYGQVELVFPESTAPQVDAGRRLRDCWQAPVVSRGASDRWSSMSASSWALRRIEGALFGGENTVNDLTRDLRLQGKLLENLPRTLIGVNLRSVFGSDEPINISLKFLLFLIQWSWDRRKTSLVRLRTFLCQLRWIKETIITSVG